MIIKKVLICAVLLNGMMHASEQSDTGYLSFPTITSTTVTGWFKEKTKLQLAFLAVGASVCLYGIYKLVDYALQKPTEDDLDEEMPTVSAHDRGILVAFADSMIADVEHMKENPDAEASTRLFDFSEMEDQYFMMESEEVKRAFVSLYNECKYDDDKIEALQMLTESLRASILEVPLND